ncbi:MAG: hypothetical protein ACREAA_10340 [Candidatus Polarisedimenticolia bacterium]
MPGRAADFHRVSHLYRLGVLPTEQPHPDTHQLSRWAAEDLPRAIAVLRRIDEQALDTMLRYAAHVDRLARAIERTLDAGGRVFLCGCGATGRLSLSVESLWNHGGGDPDRIRSFMAGGDVALVHALEGFEDHPEYGARHLEEMGFGGHDLLVSCTEGGETPYVIGATLRAAELSSVPPFFLYCNPDAILARHVERFRNVREHPGIDPVCLDVGPMALAGSTRMQASTVLQLAVGIALLHPERRACESIARHRDQVRDTDFSFLEEFVRTEAATYAAGHHVTYRVRDFGITVLTDTTERAPTFSLVPFDQLEERRETHSLCYVALEDAPTPGEAWRRLLGRPPRALDWPDVDSRTGEGYLHGFDFSAEAARRRRDQIPGRRHEELCIGRTSAGFSLEMAGRRHEVRAAHLPDLFQHLMLKQMLNIQSTLVMGRLGRYEGNLMTWVAPTNGKLIDRAARYVIHLLSRAGRGEPSYEDVVDQLFAQMEDARPGEPLVLNACQALLRRRAAS